MFLRILAFVAVIMVAASVHGHGGKPPFGVEGLSPSIDFLTTGTIRGMVDIVTSTGDTDSPTVDEMRGTFHIADNGTADNDVTYTMPTAVAGMSACFYDNGEGDGGIALAPASGANFILDGLPMANDEDLESPGVSDTGANGDFICVLAIDTTTWMTLGRSGVWVEETP